MNDDLVRICEDLERDLRKLHRKYEATAKRGDISPRVLVLGHMGEQRAAVKAAMRRIEALS